MPRRKMGYGRKRRRGGARRRLMRLNGGSFFGDVWDGVKKAGRTVYDKVLKPGHDLIKKHKLLSQALSLLPHPKAQLASKVAGELGYGRRRRGGRRKRRVGGSLITYHRPKIDNRLRIGGRRRMRGGASSLSGRLFLV